MKSGPRLPQLEKALAQKRRPNTAKNKLKKKKKKNGWQPRISILLKEKMWFSRFSATCYNALYSIERKKQESLFTYFEIVSWTRFWWRAFDTAHCHTWSNKWERVCHPQVLGQQHEEWVRTSADPYALLWLYWEDYFATELNKFLLSIYVPKVACGHPSIQPSIYSSIHPSKIYWVLMC